MRPGCIILGKRFILKKNDMSERGKRLLDEYHTFASILPARTIRGIVNTCKTVLVHGVDS